MRSCNSYQEIKTPEEIEKMETARKLREIARQERAEMRAEVEREERLIRESEED